MDRGAYERIEVCPYLPVRIQRTGVYYPSIQNAYNAAYSGDIIQCQGRELTGDLTLNKNISVCIRGGYVCDYQKISGYTIINGVIRIKNGTVELIGLVVK